jgi:hypothetical protein
MGGKMSTIEDDDLIAIGEPITNNQHHAAVQLWWIELAQRNKGNDDDNHDGGGGEEFTSTQKLEHQLREQGLEVKKKELHHHHQHDYKLCAPSFCGACCFILMFLSAYMRICLNNVQYIFTFTGGIFATRVDCS